MRVWVTGASGFVGSHLREAAADLEHIHGIELVYAAKDLDLRESRSVTAAVGSANFDGVLHLAAQSDVAASFHSPEETFDINAVGVVRLLHALESRRFAGRFLLVSSGDVYGPVNAVDLPVSESVTPRSANPYAASKLAAEAAALAWGRRGLFEVLVARPFNHVGPGQKISFAVARFASALAAMRRTSGPIELTVGRLDVSRDFLDVRDVIRAYALLLLKGRAGEIYNVCSGTERSMQAVLAALITLSGVEVTPTISTKLLRPVDVPRMVGTSNKLRAETGWRPTIAFDQTLSDLFDFYVNGLR